MELREPPPGGREVQVLLGLCSPPPRLSLASFPKAAEGRYEVRVGGWPASLPVAGNSRARSAQPCPHYPSSSEAGSGSNSSGRQLQPWAGFAEDCPSPPSLGAQLSAGRGGSGDSSGTSSSRSSSSSGSLSLFLSLSPFSFCVQVTLHGILFFWDFVIFSNMSWDLRSCNRDAKDTVSGLS